MDNGHFSYIKKLEIKKKTPLLTIQLVNEDFQVQIH
jgi:hypothetical protein